MELELKDKVAVITGGSNGIGLAVAKGLAKEGVHLALCARKEDQLQEAEREITSAYNVQVITKSVPKDCCRGIQARQRQEIALVRWCPSATT